MTIPSSAQRKLLLSFRAMYTTSICLILSLYWDWGIGLTFLSAVISSITGAYIYLGQLQFYLWRILWSGMIGTSFGLLAGYNYNNPIVMFIIILIGITIINRCSIWDHMPKVIGTLNLVLSSLRPLSTNSSFVGWKMFKVIVSVTYLPILITFLTLLIPYPALASYHAKSLICLICKKLSSMSIALIHGFYSQEYKDVYQSKYEYLYEQIDSYIEKLLFIEPFVSYEMIIFPSIHPLANSLPNYISIMKELLQLLSSLKDMLSNIQNNRTQYIFAYQMNVILYNISLEIILSLRLIYEYFNDIIIISESYDNFNYKSLLNFLSGCLSNCLSNSLSNCLSTCLPNYLANRVTDYISHYLPIYPHKIRRTTLLDEEFIWEDSSCMIYKFIKFNEYLNNLSKYELLKHSIERLIIEKKKLLNIFLLTRNKFVFYNQIGSQLDSTNDSNKDSKIDGLIDSMIDTEINCDQDGNIVENIDNQIEKQINTMIESSINGSTDSTIDNQMSNQLDKRRNSQLDDQSDYNLDNKLEDYSNKSKSQVSILIDHSETRLRSYSDRSDRSNQIYSIYQSINKENVTMRNVNPRGAYIQRLCDVINCMNKLVDLMKTKSNPWTFHAFFNRSISFGYNYVYTILYDLLTNFVEIISRLTSNKSIYSNDDYNILIKYVKLYSQPFKIALSISISSLLVIIPSLRRVFANGIWASVTISFIRQENTSSSFLIGYQRIEGTMIGAVFSFLAFSALKCNSIVAVSCSPSISLTVLILWLGICAHFREGPRHGYASFVAGFTPIVLIAGPFEGSMTNAWSRVVMTFIGTGIFIVIDNCILPIRSDDNIRNLVVEAIDESSIIFKQSLLAVETIISMEESELEENSENVLGDNPYPSVFKESSKNVLRESISKSDDIIIKLRHSSNIEISKSMMLELNKIDDNKILYTNYLHVATNSINKLSNINNKLVLYMKYVIYEPEIWTRPFPINCYQKLIISLQQLLQSGRSICLGIQSLRDVLLNDCYNNNINNDLKDILIHLKLFDFITNRLFDAISRTTNALTIASNEMKRFYETNDSNIDLSELLSLTRYFNKLINQIDDYFATTYRNAVVDLNVNVAFLVAWQNVSESVFDMINSISKLGHELYRVQNMELLALT